jgi:peptidoglycan/LPS O-acetylase OafA/YrhL
VYTGVGNDAVTARVAPALNNALNVAGRFAFGWALARVFVAVLLGRLRAVAWVLGLRVLAPIAALSYSAYLLQSIPLALLPSWASEGVATMYAAWAANLLTFALATAASLLLALPMYVVVERPFALLVRRPA